MPNSLADLTLALEAIRVADPMKPEFMAACDEAIGMIQVLRSSAHDRQWSSHMANVDETNKQNAKV
jgi:hypothetical protein